MCVCVCVCVCIGGWRLLRHLCLCTRPIRDRLVLSFSRWTTLFQTTGGSVWFLAFVWASVSSSGALATTTTVDVLKNSTGRTKLKALQKFENKLYTI